LGRLLLLGLTPATSLSFVSWRLARDLSLPGLLVSLDGFLSFAITRTALRSAKKAQTASNLFGLFRLCSIRGMAPALRRRSMLRSQA
jgi:hypothetical protein